MLSDLIKKSIFRLQSAGIESSRLDAEVIISRTLEIERFRLITDNTREVSETEMSQIEELIRRRETREPLAYIFNRKEFYSLEFYVDKNVLIPRPETELLVDMVLYEAAAGSNVLDLCTGSGAIAVACKRYRQDLSMTASDISPAALKVAGKNCHNILNNDSITFIESDLFEKISGKFNIIVSNPPYISYAFRDELEPELSFEPENALFADGDGNRIIASIIEKAPDFLTANGILLLELGKSNTEFIQESSMSRFDCSILKDYSGFDRVALLKLK